MKSIIISIVSIFLCSAAYGQTVVAPVVSPASGTQSGNVSVTMSTTTAGAGIWYTTDGSTPTLPAGGVPSGTSSTYTPMCNPIAQPALASLKNITSFGAVSGGTDNTAAINNACTAAGAPAAGTGIFIPAGQWFHTAMTLNCNIYGQGQSSELYAASATNSMITTTASNAVWSNFQSFIVSTSRDSANFNLHILNGSNNRIDTVLVQGGNAGGIFNDGSSGEIDTNNGVFNTLADSNYHTDGATNSIVDHTYTYGIHDDDISHVAYTPGPVLSGFLDQWNNVGNNSSGRGITAPGGTNFTFQHNLIRSVPGAAGIYIANETGFPESPVVNGLVQYNYLLNDSGSATGHPCILLFSDSNSTYHGSISNVVINGNVIQSCVESGIGTFATSTGTISNIKITNNAINLPGGGAWASTGTPTNVQCSGNTLNGSASSGGSCGGTDTATNTGSPLSYSGCVVGTAKQYTGAITVASPNTVKAVAVFPGETNSSIGSATYTTSVATLSSVAVTGNNSVPVGLTSQLTATGTFSDNSTANITTASAWVSSNTSICTVTPSGGLVTALVAGTCGITATDSGKSNSPAYTVTVTVPTLSAINISGTATAVAGLTTQLTATGTFSDNSTSNVTSASTWVSNNTGICTVSPSGGLVTGVSAGTCGITATDSAISNAPAFTVTISAPTLTSIGITGTNSILIGNTSQLTATGTFNNSTTSNVTNASAWVSNNTSVCTVTPGSGLVTAVAAGTCAMTATDSGVSNTPGYTVTVAVGTNNSTTMQGGTLSSGSSIH